RMEEGASRNPSTIAIGMGWEVRFMSCLSRRRWRCRSSLLLGWFGGLFGGLVRCLLAGRGPVFRCVGRLGRLLIFLIGVGLVGIGLVGIGFARFLIGIRVDLRRARGVVHLLDKGLAHIGEFALQRGE